MRCAKCGAKARGAGYPTPLGERVCRNCHDTIAGLVVGMGSGGGLSGALAGPGLLRWLGDALHPKGSRRQSESEPTDEARP